MVQRTLFAVTGNPADLTTVLRAEVLENHESLFNPHKGIKSCSLKDFRHLIHAAINCKFIASTHHDSQPNFPIFWKT